MATIAHLLTIVGIFFCTVQIIAAGHIHESEAEKKCKEEFKVDDSIFVNDGKSDDPTLKDETNNNHKCFVECLVKEMKFVKDDGKVDVDFVVSHIMKEIKDKGLEVQESDVKNKVEKCSETTGDTPCDTTYKIVKCITHKEH